MWGFFKKLKIELLYDQVIALLGIYPKDIEVVKRGAICTPMFTATMATVAKLWKEARCPSIAKWIKKIWSIYTMEYYASIRKDGQNYQDRKQHVLGCEERGTLLHSWWECKMVQPLWRTVWRYLKKLKIELPYDPAILLLDIYPKDTDVMKRRAIYL